MHRNFLFLSGAFLIGTALLLTGASRAYGATGSLIVFDEALQNGADCSSTGGQPGFPIRIGYTSVVHTGTYSIGVQDYMGVALGWCSPVPYSIASDYDGISFWVNGGTNGAENVALSLAGPDSGGNFVASATLADLYGGPIPVNSWVHIQASFYSPLFIHPSGTTAFNVITFGVFSDTSNAFFFLDDISLIGADIFKSGFEN